MFTRKDIDFIAPYYLFTEIKKHKNKLIKLSGKTEDEIDHAINIVFSRFTIYTNALIPNDIITKAKNLVFDIDVKDDIYIAFALFFQAKLWSGDKVLTKGLQVKGIDVIITTSELLIAITK